MRGLELAQQAWVQALRESAHRPPRRARLPFGSGDEVLGSVEAGLFDGLDTASLAAAGARLVAQVFGAQAGWALQPGPQGLSVALNALAAALRALGRCGPWRHEQLGVRNALGVRVATVERGAVRVLGLATEAVHLVAYAPDGRMWVQQRAFDKPNDPGLWDTLMGGMVSAADTLEQALARETWEEAGLRPEQLQGLAHGGHVDFRRPSSEADGAGYMVERIDWFRCTVPEGLAPDNQDGEVERFELMTREHLLAGLAQGRFTLEASLIALASLDAESLRA